LVESELACFKEGWMSWKKDWSRSLNWSGVRTGEYATAETRLVASLSTPSLREKRFVSVVNFIVEVVDGISRSGRVFACIKELFSSQVLSSESLASKLGSE
jgi:hypothetical protein